MPITPELLAWAEEVNAIERAEQGLPPFIEDEAALLRVSRLLAQVPAGGERCRVHPPLPPTGLEEAS